MSIKKEHFLSFSAIAMTPNEPMEYSKNYRISANSCRDNYSFFGLWVRQLFKGDNYSKEETINFYLFRVVYNVHT